MARAAGGATITRDDARWALRCAENILVECAHGDSYTDGEAVMDWVADIEAAIWHRGSGRGRFHIDGAALRSIEVSLEQVVENCDPENPPYNDTGGMTAGAGSISQTLRRLLGMAKRRDEYDY